MSLESLVRAGEIIGFVQQSAVTHQVIALVVGHEHLRYLAAHLRVGRNLHAFLVENRYLCQLVGFNQILHALFHRGTYRRDVFCQTHIQVVVLTLSLSETDHTCPVVVLGSRLLLQRLFHRSACRCEIRGVTVHQTLGFLDSRILLCKAACANQHQSCQNQCLFHK